MAGTLLTDCEVIGSAEYDNNTVGCWKADGTLLGFAIMPTGYVAFDNSTCAASITDDRIYAIADGSGATGNSGALVVWDGDGNFITATDLFNQPPYETLDCYSYCIYVPEAGKVWVAIEGAVVGQVFEYDKDGNFVQVIVDTIKSGDFIQPAYGMFRYSGSLYFNALASSGSGARGVYKTSLTVPADATRLVAEASHIIKGFAQADNGDFFVTQKTGADSVDQYDSTGAFIKTITIPGGYTRGIAVAKNQTHLWVGDENNEVICYVEIATSDIVSSFSAVVSNDGDDWIDCMALATPFGESTPPPPPNAKSGLYVMSNELRHDVDWIDVSAGTSESVKIPNPYYDTYLAGDE